MPPVLAGTRDTTFFLQDGDAPACRRVTGASGLHARGVGTMLCAFCEDTVVGHAIRRGGQKFCSPECAEGFYLTMSDDLEDDEEGEEETELSLFDDESDQVSGTREFPARHERRYALDYGDDEDERF